MIYAQIKNGIIENRIVLDDPKLEPLFLEGFDFLVRVDNLEPQPNIGWTYDGVKFHPSEEK